MLHGSQKLFDWDKDGKLSMYEWGRWYDCTIGAAEQERQRANAAAEQKRAEIAESFAAGASDIMDWMFQDLIRLEGLQKEHLERIFQLSLYAISAALQTQTMDDSLRYLLRTFWAHFQPTLDESVYQGLCAKQVLFEDIGVIRSDCLGSFWIELLYSLPPERRVGKDDDLQELLDDTNRLYNYFRDDSAPEIDYAALIEPYWAKIRLPEEPKEASNEDEEPDEEDQTENESTVPEEKTASGGFYTFCMVQFTEDGASYAYLTGGISLKAGDFVIVPAGKKNSERLARVLDVFACAAQDAPYPPEKAKFVLRKADRPAVLEEPKALPVPPVQEETPAVLVQQERENPASLEVEPVPETPTFTLPPLPEQDGPKKPKRRIPWGWLAAAALAAFVIFAVPPLERISETNRQQIAAQQAAEQEKREQEEQRAEQARLEEEAKQLRQQEEREAALQAEKDAGIPYVGMLESSIDSTRTLGTHGMAKSGWAYKKDGTFKQMTYYWYTNNRTPIFTAVCQDGKVIETQKIDGYWSGNTLLVPVVKPDIPTTFHSGSSNSGSVRDDYDNPEDLYEDHRDWYDDEDEAWDEWENG